MKQKRSSVINADFETQPGILKLVQTNQPLQKHDSSKSGAYPVQANEDPYIHPKQQPLAPPEIQQTSEQFLLTKQSQTKSSGNDLQKAKDSSYNILNSRTAANIQLQNKNYSPDPQIVTLECQDPFSQRGDKSSKQVKSNSKQKEQIVESLNELTNSSNRPLEALNLNTESLDNSPYSVQQTHKRITIYKKERNTKEDIEH